MKKILSAIFLSAIYVGLCYGQGIKVTKYVSSYDAEHHLVIDTIYKNSAFGLEFRVFSGWTLFPNKSLKSFKTSLHMDPFFGVEEYKGRLLLVDHDLNIEKCTNEQLVNSLRDTLEVTYGYMKNMPGFSVTPTLTTKQLGKYAFKVITYNYVFVNQHRSFKAAFYVRSTLNNHVLVGRLDTEELPGSTIVKQIEDGFSYQK